MHYSLDFPGLARLAELRSDKRFAACISVANGSKLTVLSVRRGIVRSLMVLPYLCRFELGLSHYNDKFPSYQFKKKSLSYFLSIVHQHFGIVIGQTLSD